MTKDEDRNKDRFKKWNLCGVWKFPYCGHRAIKLMQNCGCFINPRVNLLVSPSVTRARAYQPKVLGRLGLLHCWSPYCTCSVYWFCFLERRVIVQFEFNSYAQQKTDQVHVKSPVQRMQTTVHLALLNSSTFVDSAVTVCPIHIRLWRWVVTAHILVEIQDPWWTAVM